MKTVLLLTGCINPDGMAYTALSDPGERQRQYLEAIRFYLTNTRWPVVFVENSGTDVSHHFPQAVSAGWLECLTFRGNGDKQRGKGYGECELIDYALSHSTTLHSGSCQRIVKITGRLVVSNLRTIVRLHRLITTRHIVCCMINSDLSFPDSRLIVASTPFFQALLERKKQVNDSQGYYFEHALLDTLRHDGRFRFQPFLLLPQIIGMSGSTGQSYVAHPTTLAFRLRYVRYALSQLRRFKRQ